MSTTVVLNAKVLATLYLHLYRHTILTSSCTGADGGGDSTHYSFTRS